MGAVTWILGVAVVLALLAVLAGQLGWLSGRQPTDLGVKDGKLKQPPRSPNCVSSQTQVGSAPAGGNAYIAPLSLDGFAGTDEPMARLRTVVEAMPGARIVTARPDYLYAQFTTRLMKYVDDTEFSLDPAASVVHVRSASRVGRSDLGANRARIENIRQRLASTGIRKEPG